MTDFDSKKIFFYRAFFEHNIITKILNNPTMKIDEIIKEWEDKSHLIFDKNLLVLEFIKLNIVMQKERVISKEKDGYELRINKNIVHKIISFLINQEYNGGSFIINGTTFDDPIAFLNVVRNKFAHGDYDHKDGESKILINVNGNKIEFTPNELLTISLNIFYVKGIHSNDGFYHKIITLTNTSATKAASYNGFKDLLRKTNIIEFKVSPKVMGIILNDNEIEMVSRFIDEINAWASQYGQDNYEYREMMARLIAYSNEKNLKIDINKFQASKMNDNEQEQLKNMYFNCNEIFNDYTLDFQITFIAGWINDIIVNKNHSEIMNDGLTTLVNFAISIGEYENTQVFFNTNLTFSTCYDKMFVANLVSHFYSMYAYDFEEIFSDFVDFSLLDLDYMQPTINKIENNAMLGLPERRKKCLDAVSKSLKEIKKIEDSILAKPDKKNSYLKGLQIINDQLSINNQRLKEVDAEIDAAHKSQFGKIDNISDKDKYLTNKFVINHLRNAIAHGNVTIDRYEKYECLADCKIHFVDIYNGENTFDAWVTAKQFADILSELNAGILFKGYDKALEYKNKNIIESEQVSITNVNKKSFIKRILNKIKR